MVYIRPKSVPYPSVWKRFSVVRDGVAINLRIQDLTEDMYEPTVEMLTRYFTRDEPPCKYIGINNHPTAVAELQKLWRTTLNDKVSLVCVEDNDEGKIVGANVLTVVCKDDKEEPFHTEDKVWAALFGAVETVGKSVDIFSTYNVDKYLTAYGLVVPREWRGCKIGKEILEARVRHTATPSSSSDGILNTWNSDSDRIIAVLASSQ